MDWHTTSILNCFIRCIIAEVVKKWNRSDLMAELFREQELKPVTKAGKEKAHAEALLPRISPARAELYSPISCLSSCAANLKRTSEYASRDVQDANLVSQVADRVAQLRFEGSTPFHVRLARALQ